METAVFKRDAYYLLLLNYLFTKPMKCCNPSEIQSNI